MAINAKVFGFEELEAKLERIGVEAEPAAERAVYAAAGLTADAIKEDLQKQLSSDASGGLVSALGIASIENNDGVINTKIGFDGFNERDEPYQLIARVLESGRSDQPGRAKKPFVRPAVKRVRGPAQKIMAQVFDEEISKIEKG